MKAFILLLCVQMTVVLLACCIGDRDVVGWLKNEAGNINNGQTVSTQQQQTTFSIGLWKECNQWEQTFGEDIRRCVTCKSVKVTESLRAVRALIIVAILCDAASIVFAVMVIQMIRVKAKLISVALIAGAIFNTVAMSIFSVKANQEEIIVLDVDMKYDWAFAMGWFTAVESTIVAVGVFVWSLRTGL